MNWLQYAKKGTEAVVQEAVLSLGSDTLQCFAPMQFVGRRRGKRRKAEAEEEAVIPGLLWFRGTSEDWHRVQSDEIARLGMWGTHKFFSDKAWEKLAAPWIDRHAALYADQKRRIEAGEKMEAFAAGDQLEIDRGGEFERLVGDFLRMVERPHHDFPHVLVEVDMMGRVVEIEVDPLAVRKRA